MNKNKKGTRILFFDIENAPNLAYVWGMWDQNVIEFKEEWYLLSFAYKWLGDKKTKVLSLPDFKGYKKNRSNDKHLVAELWKLFDEADVIIGHNSDRFDIRKTNARFLEHGMPIPSPYKTVDTLKVARRNFQFNSNRLNHLTTALALGKKEKTGGFELWRGCMDGDMKAWKKMIKYNKHDVVLLEKLYLALRPWVKSHPNRALMDGKERACPKCGSGKVHAKGFSYTTVGKYRRWQCTDCGGWSQSRIPEKDFPKPELK